MIKINLLPKKEYGKREFDADISILVVILVLTFALVGGIYLKNSRDVSRMRAEMADLDRQRESLRGVYKEFADIEKQKKELAARIAVIDRIREGRALAPRMLYDLSSLMTDNLWLKKLRKDDSKLDIEGRSTDNESICSFVEGLSRLSYMKDVELKSVEDVAESGTTVKKFLVEGMVSS
ncbi:MAG: PilN domain-containing protein [Syntrophorhabdales bacterium]|jgi:Tfp pilus assembly protein PilN